MSEKVADNKHFENKYDNADLQSDRTTKDIAAAYTQFDEMRAYKLYLETIKLEAEMQASNAKVKSRMVKADGSIDEKEIDVTDLIQEQSEFEQARRRIIVKLNKLLRTANGVARYKQLQAQLETESVFELSSKITNYLMDKGRRDQLANEFKFY